METGKVLLSETIYRTKDQAIEKNSVTKYLTWGIVEYTLKDNKKVIDHIQSFKDESEEVPIFSLTHEQDKAIAEKGFWQCLHDGTKCAQIKE